MRGNRLLSLVLCLFAVCAAGGCASDRPAASDLASRGEEAVRNVQASMLASQIGLDTLVEQRVALEALTGRPPLSEGAKASIQKVQSALALRVAMLDDLAGLYKAWFDLADYDAAKEVANSVGELSGSVNAFAAATGADTAPVSDAMTKLVARTTGLIAAGDQNSKLKQGSVIAREALTQVIDLLRKEQQAHVSIRKELVIKAEQTSQALADAGVGTPMPVLQSLLGTSGYALDEAKADAALADATTGPKLRTAVNSVLEVRAARKVALQEVQYSQALAVLEKIKSEHAAFEEGKPIDIQGIISSMAMLRVLIGDITDVAVEHR